MKDFPTIGAFYQCYKRPKAFEEVISRFRAIYPDSDIVVVNDGGDDLSAIAHTYGCDYSLDARNMGNGIDMNVRSKRPLWIWLERFCAAAQKIKQDYILILEDDAWIWKQITSLPYTLNGMNPEVRIGPSATAFLKERNNSIPKEVENYFYGGAGGAVIKKDFVLKHFAAYKEAIEEIESHLDTTHHGIFVTDLWISLLTLYFGGTLGQYPGYCERGTKGYFMRRYILRNVEVTHQEKALYSA